MCALHPRLTETLKNCSFDLHFTAGFFTNSIHFFAFLLIFRRFSLLLPLAPPAFSITHSQGAPSAQCTYLGVYPYFVMLGASSLPLA